MARIFNQHGTKEKLFEMMNRVNKISLNENISESKSSVNESKNQEIYDELEMRYSSSLNGVPSNEFSEIADMYGVDEEYVLEIYSDVLGDMGQKRDEELMDMVNDLFDEHEISFDSLHKISAKELYQLLDSVFDVSKYTENDVRKLYDKLTKDPNQLKLFPEGKEKKNESFDSPKEDDEEYLDKTTDPKGTQANKYDKGYHYPSIDALKVDHEQLKKLAEELDLDDIDNDGDQLEGGLADDADVMDFDKDQILRGIEVEMEHTNDPRIALEIAMDHLKEIPDYYTHLEDMESEAGVEEASRLEVKDDEEDNEYVDFYEGEIFEDENLDNIMKMADLAKDMEDKFKNIRFNYQDGIYVPEGFEKYNYGIRKVEQPLGSGNEKFLVTNMGNDNDIVADVDTMEDAKATLMGVILTDMAKS